MWAGNEILPHDAYIVYFMEQRAPRLTDSDIIEGSKILKYLKHKKPVIKFDSVRSGD